MKIIIPSSFESFFILNTPPSNFYYVHLKAQKKNRDDFYVWENLTNHTFKNLVLQDKAHIGKHLKPNLKFEKRVVIFQDKCALMLICGHYDRKIPFRCWFRLITNELAKKWHTSCFLVNWQAVWNNSLSDLCAKWIEMPRDDSIPPLFEKNDCATKNVLGR